VRWRGADGTEMLAYRFGAGGYCDYTFEVRHARAACCSCTGRNGVLPTSTRYLRYEAEHTEVDPILLFRRR
jgi:hypothetical protein